MLLHLHVKNFALIDEAEVDFTKGLNILTGETGAGKSVLLGSVNLALGAKADKDLIRQGAEYAFVELIFQPDNELQYEALRKMDLPVEDGMVILQRKIQPGRSISKVCGETVTAAQLKELAPLLLDIYGQHDYQSLMHAPKHLSVLDSFASEEARGCMKSYRECYDTYCDLKRQMEAPEMSEAERERELSFAVFEAEEIEQASIKIGELEELEKRLSKMENHEKIMKAVSGAIYFMQESDSAAVLSLERAVRELNPVGHADTQIAEFASRLESLDMDLTYLVREMSDFLEESEFDEQDFEIVRERVNLINRLIMKYGKNEEDVLKYAERLQERIIYLQNAQEAKSKLEKELCQKEEVLHSLAKELRSYRKKDARMLEQEITEALVDLNFLQVKFEISFEETSDFTINGCDKVVFLISTNIGEPLKPISQVASGGELSRIMLAIKTVSARRDDINTLIFDEIDSGISGKTAWKVSEMLGRLARDHQIISITHLPQIAAMSDSHFQIMKQETDERTKTEITILDEKGSLDEIARLLGGDVITQATIENAKELREQAKKVKIG